MGDQIFFIFDNFFLWHISHGCIIRSPIKSRQAKLDLDIGSMVVCRKHVFLENHCLNCGTVSKSVFHHLVISRKIYFSHILLYKGKTQIINQIYRVRVDELFNDLRSKMKRCVEEQIWRYYYPRLYSKIVRNNFIPPNISLNPFNSRQVESSGFLWLLNDGTKTNVHQTNKALDSIPMPCWSKGSRTLHMAEEWKVF